MDLFNKKNKVNFQAIAAVVIENFKVVYFCETKRFILFYLFVVNVVVAFFDLTFKV